MIGFAQVSRWIAVVTASALITTTGFSTFGSTPARSAPVQEEFRLHLSARAQAEDQPDIEQVGEGEDTETLDEGEDTETLDEGAPPVQQAGDDIEPLDQGAPPATLPALAAESTVAPAETVAVPQVSTAVTVPTDNGVVYTAPVSQPATGPVLPPGFGTGRVHVSAGRFGFPVGLEECHVGAVTGRAYVGIDCGDNEGNVVGHAASFEDFPFVLEAEFPFESSDAFFSDPFFTDRDDADSESDSDVVVSTARPAGSDSAEAENVVVTGNGSVELKQRARDREPRVRTSKSSANQQAKKQKAKDNNSNTYVASGNDNGAKSESRANQRSKEVKQTAKGQNKHDGKDKKAKGSKKKRGKRHSGKKN